MVVGQVPLRPAHVVVTDVPGRVVLPSLFYALDGTLHCSHGRVKCLFVSKNSRSSHLLVADQLGCSWCAGAMDEVRTGSPATSGLPVGRHPLFSERFGAIDGGRRVPAAPGHRGHKQFALQAKSLAPAKRKHLQVFGHSMVDCLRAGTCYKNAVMRYKSPKADSLCRQASGKVPRRGAAGGSEPLRAVDLNMETDEEKAEDQEQQKEGETEPEDDGDKDSAGASSEEDGTQATWQWPAKRSPPMLHDSQEVLKMRPAKRQARTRRTGG